MTNSIGKGFMYKVPFTAEVKRESEQTIHLSVWCQKFMHSPSWLFTAVLKVEASLLFVPSLLL
jgi:hypothetical protein